MVAFFAALWALVSMDVTIATVEQEKRYHSTTFDHFITHQASSIRFGKRQQLTTETQMVFGRVYSAVARHDTNTNDGIGPGADQYILYTGNGSSFPAMSAWISFADMWNNNMPLMLTSCSQFAQPNPSQNELDILYDAIQRVSQTTYLDHRFILAVVLQESTGCVRAPTTNYGVRNPGLMQDHNGAWTCNDNGLVLDPCPFHWINNMIDEGSRGTSSGEGLVQVLNGARLAWLYTPGAIDFYVAARMYNSGSYSSQSILSDMVIPYADIKQLGVWSADMRPTVMQAILRTV